MSRVWENASVWAGDPSGRCGLWWMNPPMMAWQSCAYFSVCRMCSCQKSSRSCDHGTTVFPGLVAIRYRNCRYCRSTFIGLRVSSHHHFFLKANFLRTGSRSRAMILSHCSSISGASAWIYFNNPLLAFHRNCALLAQPRPPSTRSICFSHSRGQPKTTLTYTFDGVSSFARFCREGEKGGSIDPAPSARRPSASPA
jgi:hypothetical protein